MLKIKLAKAQASGDDTSDIEDKISEEQYVASLVVVALVRDG